jgi:hypothetical protein
MAIAYRLGTTDSGSPRVLGRGQLKLSRFGEMKVSFQLPQETINGSALGCSR